VRKTRAAGRCAQFMRRTCRHTRHNWARGRPSVASNLRWLLSMHRADEVHASRKVLLVSGSETTRNNVKQALQASRYDVVSMHSPIGVLSRGTRGSVSVVVIDVTQDGLASEGLAELFRERTKQHPIPIIVVCDDIDFDRVYSKHARRGLSVMSSAVLAQSLAATVELAMRSVEEQQRPVQRNATTRKPWNSSAIAPAFASPTRHLNAASRR